MAVILCSLLVYAALLLGFSRWSSGRATNESFFRGERRSPWPMVAWGMIGASISGVTFVSVPGMVLTQDMTYLQMCLGFIVGYIVVATVLLPVYYRLNLTSIYTYLQRRLGNRSYLTGSGFFLLSKMLGAVVKFYVVCMLLHRYLLQPVGIPLPVTVAVLVLLIWLYTRRGGIKTLVWTDSFQTLCMLTALVLIIGGVMAVIHYSPGDAVRAIADDGRSRIFVTDDWMSRQFFWKQFLSGVFVVVVMTGLDQDMMQKNLTCRTLREAQKDMCCYGVAFVPVNLLFLSLGILLAQLAVQQGVALPVRGDELLPMYAATGQLGTAVVCFFVIGVVAASFSSADSALTAMTTTCCVDLFRRTDDVVLRKRVHAGLSLVFALFIMLFHVLNSTSLLDAIYTLVAYTYGPLLGLFAFGLFTRRRVCDRCVPFIAVASPLLCLAIDKACGSLFDYHFGYELLLLNGFLTFAGLWLTGGVLPSSPEPEDSFVVGG